MFKNIIITCVLGAIAVALGAFGSHGLKDTLTSTQLDSFMIAVRYHSYYVLLLLLINLYNGFTEKQKNVLSTILILGILFFSGSIYLIQLTPITAKQIWFITPLGGLFFIIAWIVLAIYFLKKLKKQENSK